MDWSPGRTSDPFLLAHSPRPIVIGRTEQPGFQLAELSPDGSSGHRVMVVAANMGRAGTMVVAAEVAGAGQLAVEEAVVFRGL